MFTDICNICYESKPLESFTIISPCMHTFCTACLLQYIHYISGSKEYYNLKCPFTSCLNKEIDSIVKRLLPDCEYQEFNKEKYNAILSLDPTIRWCPTPDCKGYSKISESPYLTCNMCASLFCHKCSQIWAEAHKCENNTGFHKYLKNLGAKACPGCKNLVEKKSGCTSMTCRCGTVFCMTCGEVITAKHDGVKCLFGLDRPSIFVILGLLFSLALFPFHFGWYMVRINLLDVKDSNGRSVYTCGNVIGYFLLYLVSPFIILFIALISPMVMIGARDGGVNKSLPKTKWFWPIKPLVWLLLYLVFLLLVIVCYMIFNVYLTIRGVIALVKKIFIR